MITCHQVDLVQSSFAKVAPIADAAAAMFYERLFELDPSLRPMFRGDMAEQGKKLMDMLKMVVANLRNLDRLIPGVRALGERHSGYGVRDEHYETVGTALLDTLERGLGSFFTADVREAWAAAYSVLANTMKEAAAVAA
ncbi:MAG TPA: globin family protein [Thermoanaerobaculia bacterium]